MASTVIGVFETRLEAEEVAQQLVNNGLDQVDIGLVACPSGPDRIEMVKAPGEELSPPDDRSVEARSEAAAPSAATTLPGIGPVHTRGPLAADLEACAGSGLVGALKLRGLSDDEAGEYAEAVRRGGALLTFTSENPNQIEVAADVMRRHRAINLGERVVQWRREGWRGFDEKAASHAPPARPSDVIAESHPASILEPEGAADDNVRIVQHALRRPADRLPGEEPAKGLKSQWDNTGVARPPSPTKEEMRRR